MNHLETLEYLEGELVVDAVDVGVECVVLETKDGVLPDSTQSSSWVSSDGAPGGAGTEELEANGPGGQKVLDLGSGASEAAEVSKVAESIVGEDVLGDQRAAVEDHDSLGSELAGVGDEGVLGEDVLAKLLAEAVIDGDLNFLYNKHDSGLVVEVVGEIGGAEEVVQVAVEAVVD